MFKIPTSLLYYLPYPLYKALTKFLDRPELRILLKDVDEDFSVFEHVFIEQGEERFDRVCRGAFESDVLMEGDHIDHLLPYGENMYKLIDRLAKKGLQITN